MNKPKILKGDKLSLTIPSYDMEEKEGHTFIATEDEFKGMINHMCVSVKSLETGKEYPYIHASRFTKQDLDNQD